MKYEKEPKSIMALSKTIFFQLTCILITSLAALLLLLVVGAAVGFGLKRDFEVEVAEGGCQCYFGADIPPISMISLMLTPNLYHRHNLKLFSSLRCWTMGNLDILLCAT